MARSQWRLVIALGLVYVVWGSTYLAIRFAVETMPPLLMAGVRFVVAGGLLLSWRRWRGDALPTLRQFRNANLVGALLLLGGNGCVVIAQTWIASGLAALLVATVPLFVALFDWLRPQGRRPSWVVGVGLVLGFVGIALLIDPGTVGGEGAADLLGGTLLLLAAASWSAGTVYARHADLPASDLMGAAIYMLSGGFWLLVAAVVRGELTGFDLAVVSATSAWGLAYLILFGSLVGFVAYSWLMRNADSTLVSTYAYVNPVIAVLLGWLLAGEVITGRTVVAGAIVLVAVGLITQSRRVATRAAVVPPCLAKENAATRI